jgi:hypothetical protein
MSSREDREILLSEENPHVDHQVLRRDDYSMPATLAAQEPAVASCSDGGAAGVDPELGLGEIDQQVVLSL